MEPVETGVHPKEITGPQPLNNLTFYPRKQWGDSPLADYFLSRESSDRTCRKVEDPFELQNVWEVNANSRYTPSTILEGITIEDLNNLEQYVDGMQYEDLLPLVLKYGHAYNITTEESPDSLYRKDKDNWGGGPVVAYHKRLEIDKTKKIPDLVLIAQSEKNGVDSIDKVGATFFVAKLVQSRLQNPSQSLETIVDDLEQKYSLSKIQIIDAIWKGTIGLTSKKMQNDLFKALNVNIGDIETQKSWYSLLSSQLAEVGLMRVRDSSRKNGDHSASVFYPMGSEDQVSLSFFPYLMKSFTLFTENIPNVLPQGKFYPVESIFFDTKKLYNYFFKLINAPKLQFGANDELNNQGFLKRCEMIMRAYSGKISDENLDDGEKARAKQIIDFLNQVKEAVPQLEKATLYMNTQQRANMNNTRPVERDYSIPSFYDRLNDIRSHGGDVSAKTAKWNFRGEVK